MNRSLRGQKKIGQQSQPILTKLKNSESEAIREGESVDFAFDVQYLAAFSDYMYM